MNIIPQFSLHQIILLTHFEGLRKLHQVEKLHYRHQMWTMK
jgi:hypothetical protein